MSSTRAAISIASAPSAMISDASAPMKPFFVKRNARGDAPRSLTGARRERSYVAET